ncbi:MAG TPA: NAD(P)/FAD-dependent oxidoreductase [Steroidobacteraceae bacterium]|nr:NAD(P)/FAD-dependent oxidoreductase [Steroidobacteraceae bacterium]
MGTRYDLIVVGSGVAASGVASRVRQAGRSVAVIDCRPLGGTCALRGCDPKKVLVSGAETVRAARRLDGRGVRGGLAIDWADLMSFKRGFTDPVPEQRARGFREAGIDVFHGTARFTGPRELAVADTGLEARNIVLAAGAEPVTLGIPGQEHLITHEGFLSLEALPERIVFIGGGYIAAEFSNIAALSGARVTVLQRSERMLTGFDPDLVGWLMESFRAMGIEVVTGAKVQAIEAGEGSAGGRTGTSRGFTVRYSSAGAAGPVQADLVVHAAGRRPAWEMLDLEAGGVAADDRGRLRLNEWLQSESNPAVYAAGDCAQRGPPLTPVAGRDAEIVAANLLEGNTRTADYRAVPTVAFTLPPIAAVGLGEAAAREASRDVRVHCGKASDWYTARRIAEPVYGFKVLVDGKSRRVLGAHLVGPGAEETINLFALAIRERLTTDALREALFTYPTAASDIAYML